MLPPARDGGRAWRLPARHWRPEPLFSEPWRRAPLLSELSLSEPWRSGLCRDPTWPRRRGRRQPCKAGFRRRPPVPRRDPLTPQATTSFRPQRSPRQGGQAAPTEGPSAGSAPLSADARRRHARTGTPSGRASAREEAAESIHGAPGNPGAAPPAGWQAACHLAADRGPPPWPGPTHGPHRCPPAPRLPHAPGTGRRSRRSAASGSLGLPQDPAGWTDARHGDPRHGVPRPAGPSPAAPRQRPAGPSPAAPRQCPAAPSQMPTSGRRASSNFGPMPSTASSSCTVLKRPCC